MKKRILTLILMLASACQAANEVQIAYAVGNNLYFRVFNAAGQVWNTSGTPAFEAWADGNVTDYDVALTGTGGSYYLGTFPDPADGTYSVVAYLRAAGAPAVGDGVLSAGFMEWRSSAEVDWSAMIDDLAAVLTDTAEIQGKLPTNKFMGSSDGADDDGTLNTILTDTNEIQGKLPTNKFMGSSDGANDDGTLNTIVSELSSIASAVDGLSAECAQRVAQAGSQP